MVWLIAPLTLLFFANGWSAYRNALQGANAAYDRTLLASARTIAESLHAEAGRLTLAIPFSATDLMETDIRGRLYYRVIDTNGQHLAGFADLPSMSPGVPRSRDYSLLVHFYEDQYRGDPIRVAALYQPIARGDVHGMALVQVAETLETRLQLIESILFDTMWRQALLIVTTGLLVSWGIRRALRPLERLSRELGSRDSQDLRPFEAGDVHAEFSPLVRALNAYMARLRSLIDLRKRFIANAAHQLRTPLAVLTTQVAYAQRQNAPAAVRETLDAVGASLQDASRLAHQLLSLTRAEHGFAVEHAQAVALATLARDLCLEWLPRAHDAGVDFGLEISSDAGEAEVLGDPTMLRELLANLIDNALRYGHVGPRMTVRVSRACDSDSCRLEVEDTGAGIPAQEFDRVFGRFYRVPGQTKPGTGLGLAIVREIAQQHGAIVSLFQTEGGGLTVRVDFREPA